MDVRAAAAPPTAAPLAAAPPKMREAARGFETQVLSQLLRKRRFRTLLWGA